MINIFITEEIPSLNKGEAAILKGILSSFNELGDIRVSMLSFNPKEDILRYENKIKIIPFVYNNLPDQSKIAIIIKGLIFTFKYTLFCLLYRILGPTAINKIMKAEIWKAYNESDILICGHDSLLQELDDRGFKNRFNSNMTFISTFYNIILAKIFLRKKIVIYGGSIGKFRSKLIKTLARIALNKADLITLREKLSYNYLNEIGVKSKKCVTADLAFCMEPASDERIKEILLKENIKISKKLVGLSANTELYRFTLPKIKDLKYKYEKYILFKAKVIDYLIEELDVNVILIPHAFKKKKDDRIVIKDIFSNVVNKNRVTLILNEYSPEELKGIIGVCDLFIGERTHSNVAAVSMGVPTISISEPNSHRNKGIFAGIIGERFICEISEISFDQIIKTINYAWRNRYKIKRKLIDKTKFLKEKALYNGALLKELLDSKNK
ncbi:MAG: polysaccharide pyruvyl transferase family protein [Candidatus Pacebacteria bacterium]|nr:polysaccharide pyruvyl transferase family protein [Candidatus Paceibacterota bacterium]